VSGAALETFAVTWLPKGSVRPSTVWHDTEDEADVTAWRLRMLGLAHVVVWADWGVYA
jgi:hypothetical protein